MIRLGTVQDVVVAHGVGENMYGQDGIFVQQTGEFDFGAAEHPFMAMDADTVHPQFPLVVDPFGDKKELFAIRYGHVGCVDGIYPGPAFHGDEFLIVVGILQIGAERRIRRQKIRLHIAGNGGREGRIAGLRGN